MAHYDSNKVYENKKEMVMIRFIIPISLSYFRVIEKFEYSTDKDVIEINADNLSVVIGSESKVLKGKPTKEQKGILVRVKKMFDGYKNFL